MSRITTEEMIVPMDILDRTTGEIVSFSGTLKRSHRNYSIKRLNMKTWDIGIDWVIQKVCASRLDIAMFNYIKQSIDKNNEVRIVQKNMGSGLQQCRDSQIK